VGDDELDVLESSRILRDDPLVHERLARRQREIGIVDGGAVAEVRRIDHWGIGYVAQPIAGRLS